MGVYRNPNGTWRAHLRRKGAELDKTFRTEAEARQAIEDILNGPAAQLEKQKGMSLQEAWEAYQKSRKFITKANWTKKTETKRIKNVLKELGHYSISTLEERHDLIHAYIDARTVEVSPKTKQTYSGTSIRLELAALSAVTKFLTSRKILRENFMKTIERPGPEYKKRRVGAIEQAKLIQTTAVKEEEQLGEDARLVMLLRALGCRPGELSTLLREDINFIRREHHRPGHLLRQYFAGTA